MKRFAIAKVLFIRIIGRYIRRKDCHQNEQKSQCAVNGQFYLCMVFFYFLFSYSNLLFFHYASSCPRRILGSR